SRLEVGVVAGAGELEHAVDVVLGIAVIGEGIATANRMDGKRVGLLAVATQGAAEDAGRIKLVAAELRHQAASRPLEEPPANELFESRAGLAVPRQLEVLIAVLLGFNVAIEKPGFPLS